MKKLILGVVAVSFVTLLLASDVYANGSKTNWATDIKRKSSQTSGVSDVTTADDERNAVRYEYINITDSGAGSTGANGPTTRVINRYRFVKAGRAIVQGDLLTLDTGSSGFTETGALVLRPISTTLDTGNGGANRLLWALGWDQIDSGSYGWVLEDGVCTGVLCSTETTDTVAPAGELLSNTDGGRIATLRVVALKHGLTAGTVGQRAKLVNLETLVLGERKRVYISQ